MTCQLCGQPLTADTLVLVVYQRRAMHLCLDCAVQAVKGIRQQIRMDQSATAAMTEADGAY